jgi:SAM-dependent methyltransferase
MPQPVPVVSSPSSYTFKQGAYSSHSLLIAHLPDNGKSRRVLDVGGGEGYLSKVLVMRGYDVVCLALHGTAIEPFPDGVHLIETDLDCKKPKLNGVFDYIICGDVLEHLRDPHATLTWLRSLLRPGGLLLASLPNSGHLYFRLTVLLGRFPQHDRGLFDRTHLHFYTWTGWSELFRRAGFRIAQVTGTVVPIALALGWKDDGALTKHIDSVGYFLSNLWKSLLAYQFVVKAAPRDL